MRKFIVSSSTVLACLVLFSGCGDKKQAGPAGGDSAGKVYPDLYAELPQYPGAKLVDTGRQTSSLKDGIRLRLESNDDLQKIADYYDEKLKALGWTTKIDPKKPRPALTNLHFRVYEKGNLKFHVNIVKMTEDQPAVINLNYLQP